MKAQILTPIGRIVQGDARKGNDKDKKGVPYKYKSGPNMGQPYNKYFIAIAIPKTEQTRFGIKEDGQSQFAPCDIWAIAKRVALSGWPELTTQRNDFSWKIVDGDGLDNFNKPNSEREGFAGCWVIKCTCNGFAPSLFDVGGVPLTEHTKLKRGDYARVVFSMEPNKSEDSPGIYVNHSAICWEGHGAEIVGGINGEELFGSAALGPAPAGMSATPVGPAPAASAAPTPPAASAPPPAAATPAPAPAPGGQVPAAPVPPAPPAAVAPPPPAPVWVPEMTPSAQAAGLTYEALQAAGWSVDQMFDAGHVKDKPPF